MINNTSVLEELAGSLGPTAELVVACLIWAVPAGIGLGALAAMNRGGWIDRAIIAVSVVGVSTPVFFFALVLMIWLGYHWQLFPFLGRPGRSGRWRACTRSCCRRSPSASPSSAPWRA